MVRRAFHTSWFPDNLNQTLIALIMKIDNPTRMNNLRHISLCNTTYKITTKIIVNRTKPILHDLINLVHASFVLRRQISNNVLIVQEVLNVFRREKGKKGFIV